MPPIVMTICIEGDLEGTIDALRRIAAVGDYHELQGTPELPHGNNSWDESEQISPELETSTEFELPEGSRQMWEDRIANSGRRQPLPEPSWPAQWDKHLSDELVSNMSENARRLVAVLAVAGAEGMTRGAITSELGIETDTIRTTQVSIGHALRRVQRANGNVNLPRPVEFHKRLDTYMLNPGFRAAIQDS